MTARPTRWPTLVTLVIGVGLALAPVAFKMFERAPLGGDMIDDFAPYMTEQKIGNFRGYMDTIGNAVDEAEGLKAAVVDQGSISADEYDTQFVLVKQLTDGWDGIDTDMTDLLDRMDRNMGNYHDVAALPSFDLFSPSRRTTRSARCGCRAREHRAAATYADPVGIRGWRRTVGRTRRRCRGSPAPRRTACRTCRPRCRRCCTGPRRGRRCRRGPAHARDPGTDRRTRHRAPCRS